MEASCFYLQFVPYSFQVESRVKKILKRIWKKAHLSSKYSGSPSEISFIGTFTSPVPSSLSSTAQKIKFSIKDFFSKCDQIRSFLQWSKTASGGIWSTTRSWVCYCRVMLKHGLKSHCWRWECCWGCWTLRKLSSSESLAIQSDKYSSTAMQPPVIYLLFWSFWSLGFANQQSII